MKICPACRTTYTDDGLNFCLEDGSVLTPAPASLEETVVMERPRATDAITPRTVPGIQTSWDNQAQYSVQPKRSSKAWVWVLGILGGLVLLCGGGFVAFLAFVGSMADSTANVESHRSDTPANRASATPSPSPFDSASFQTVNLTDWVSSSSPWGNTEMNGGEFVMTSKGRGFYYVLVAPEEYRSEAGSARVTVRNVNDAASSLGYGLIFHSEPTPLTLDYAFLIDAKRRKFRLVRHEPGKETTVVGWTTSPSIKEGSAENILEARNNNGKIELLINGTLVNTVKNSSGPKAGVAGLYASDAIKVGFKDLQVNRQ